MVLWRLKSWIKLCHYKNRKVATRKKQRRNIFIELWRCLSRKVLKLGSSFLRRIKACFVLFSSKWLTKACEFRSVSRQFSNLEAAFLKKRSLLFFPSAKKPTCNLHETRQIASIIQIAINHKFIKEHCGIIWVTYSARNYYEYKLIRITSLLWNPSKNQ